MINSEIETDTVPKLKPAQNPIDRPPEPPSTAVLRLGAPLAEIFIPIHLGDPVLTATMSGNSSCSVYIGNLDERVSDRVLYDILIQAGRVVDLYIPRDKETDKPKGFAFVEYETEDVADYAVRLFSGLVTLYNRTLKFAISGQDKSSQNPANAAMPATNSSYKSRHYHGVVTTWKPLSSQRSLQPLLGFRIFLHVTAKVIMSSIVCFFYYLTPPPPGVSHHFNGYGSHINDIDYEYSRRVLGQHGIALVALGHVAMTQEKKPTPIFPFPSPILDISIFCLPSANNNSQHQTSTFIFDFSIFVFRCQNLRWCSSSSLKVDNLEEEFALIREIVDTYNYVAMDTEFAGVCGKRFGELLMSSGVVLNDDSSWVFRFDQDIFPLVYDIKHMMKFCNSLHGGLNKLVVLLEVERVDVCHQAGSDSLLTLCTFRKL
ncbi:hypothetical protein CXB51_004765 [Gossypium anomalum]|uniref:RRM domain-containing protein n=1 Tax=Gossypium anomalum TaxID=47600 RepID=A0A8J6D7T4_9ROSI|nr:hypothetical protein CXB51_004765 [Gossypium anomalum]